MNFLLTDSLKLKEFVRPEVGKELAESRFFLNAQASPWDRQYWRPNGEAEAKKRQGLHQKMPFKHKKLIIINY